MYLDNKIESMSTYLEQRRLQKLGITTVSKVEVKKIIEKKKIKPRSKKLSDLMKKEYVPQVKKMIEAKTPCSLKTEMCTGKAEGFHHPYGKASKELLLKEKVPACNACNLWVEVNDKEARERGLKKSKFSIPAKNQKSVIQ